MNAKILLSIVFFLTIFSISVNAISYEPNKIILGETWDEPYNMSKVLMFYNDNDSITAHDTVAWCGAGLYQWGKGSEQYGFNSIPSGDCNQIEVEDIIPERHAEHLFYIWTDTNKFYLLDEYGRQWSQIDLNGNNIDGSYVKNPSDYDYIIYSLDDNVSGNRVVERWSLYGTTYDYASMILPTDPIYHDIDSAQVIVTDGEDRFWLSSTVDSGNYTIFRLWGCWDVSSCHNETYLCWNFPPICTRKVCELNASACGLYASMPTAFPHGYRVRDIDVAHRIDGDYVILSFSGENESGSDNVVAYFKLGQEDVGGSGQCTSDKDCVLLCMNGTISPPSGWTCGQLGCNSTNYCVREYHSTEINDTNDKGGFTEIYHLPFGYSDDSAIGTGKGGGEFVYFVINDKLFYSGDNFTNQIAELTDAKHMDIYPNYRIPVGSYYISNPFDMGLPTDFVSYDTNPPEEDVKLNVTMRSSPDGKEWSDWYPVADVPENRFYQVKIVFNYKKSYPINVEWTTLDSLTLYYFQRPKGQRGYANLTVCPLISGSPTTNFSVVIKEKVFRNFEEQYDVVTYGYEPSLNCKTFRLEKGIYEVSVFKPYAGAVRPFGKWKQEIILVEDKTISPDMKIYDSQYTCDIDIQLLDEDYGFVVSNPNNVYVYVDGYPFVQTNDSLIHTKGLIIGEDYLWIATAPHYYNTTFETERCLRTLEHIYIKKSEALINISVIDENNTPIGGANLKITDENGTVIFDSIIGSNYQTYIPFGKYDFEISKSGYLTVSESYDIDKDTAITIQLKVAVSGYILPIIINSINGTVSGFILSAKEKYNATILLIFSGFGLLIIFFFISSMLPKENHTFLFSLSSILLILLFFVIIGFMPEILLILIVIAVGLLFAYIFKKVFLGD